MDWNVKSASREYNRILSEIDEVYHTISLRQGIPDSAMTVLYILADHDGVCLLAELVRQSGLSKQTINSALRKLEAAGTVSLESVGGRTKRVRFTEKGRITAHETVDRVIEMENEIYASWPREEWELYMRLTERYLCQLREKMKEL